jgi:hypothetical protein
MPPQVYAPILAGQHPAARSGRSGNGRKPFRTGGQAVLAAIAPTLRCRANTKYIAKQLAKSAAIRK